MVSFVHPGKKVWCLLFTLAKMPGVFWVWCLLSGSHLCLVSGGFHVANFGLFFTEVKVAKSSDIARNMLPSITMFTYMPTEVRKYVCLQFKKPPLILF